MSCYFSLTNKRLYVIPIFCILVLIMPSFAFSTEKEVIHIVRGDYDYPPYEVKTANNTLTGLHIDMVNAVVEKLNMTVKFQSVPWKRALHMIRNGQADAITYIGISKEREKFALFLEDNILTIADNAFFLLTKKGKVPHYTGDLKQLKSYRIGTIMGFYYGEQFGAANYLMIDNKAKSNEALLKRLVNNHFDIGLADIHRTKYLAKEEGLGGMLSYFSALFPSIPQYIAFSRARKNSPLAQKFATAMRAFKRSDEYIQLLKKYDIDPTTLGVAQ